MAIGRQLQIYTKVKLECGHSTIVAKYKHVGENSNCLKCHKRRKVVRILKRFRR